MKDNTPTVIIPKTCQEGNMIIVDKGELVVVPAYKGRAGGYFKDIGMGLGIAKDKPYIPKVVIDDEGYYVLIFIKKG